MAARTLKRNIETWDPEQFAAMQQTMRLETWAMLRSVNPEYPSIAVTTNEIIFGRREDAHVVVADAAVSFTHCKLWREKSSDNDHDDSKEDSIFDDDDDDTDTHHVPGHDRVYLMDLSTNGTFVKGKRMNKNDVVEITSGTEVSSVC
jgi:FHA domain